MYENTYCETRLVKAKTLQKPSFHNLIKFTMILKNVWGSIEGA
jgi:hypothetical protein